MSLLHDFTLRWKEKWATQPWLIFYLSLLLMPVGWGLAGGLPLAPGTTSLVLLTIPTCLAASTGRRGPAIACVMVGCFACIMEAGFGIGHVNRGGDWGFASIGCGLLLTLSGMMLGLAEAQAGSPYPRQRSRDFSASHRAGHSLLDAQELAQHLDDDLHGISGPSHRSQTRRESLHSDLNPPLDSHRWLETMEDVVRKIVSDLNLDTLRPTIESTGCSLLHARTCRLYLWNQAQKELICVPDAGTGRVVTVAADEERGVVRWVLAERKLAHRIDPRADVALKRLFQSDPAGPDAVVPLVVGGELLGLIVFEQMREKSSEATRILAILGNVSALAIKNAQLFARIEEMALHDGLTGLLNHASFLTELEDRLAWSRSQRQPLSVILGDIDHFKRFNDQFGHPAGDYVLREAARIWTAILPEHAMVGRYGGEEFICLMVGVDRQEALELAEQVRQQLERFPFTYHGHALEVTASFGVAEAAPKSTIETIVQQADTALYAAKNAGRNRVHAAG